METIYILFENYEVWEYNWLVEGYTTNKSLANNWVNEDEKNRKYEAVSNYDSVLYKKYGIGEI
jgi:hypothetical protein